MYGQCYQFSKNATMMNDLVELGVSKILGHAKKITAAPS